MTLIAMIMVLLSALPKRCLIVDVFGRTAQPRAALVFRLQRVHVACFCQGHDLGQPAAEPGVGGLAEIRQRRPRAFLQLAAHSLAFTDHQGEVAFVSPIGSGMVSTAGSMFQ